MKTLENQIVVISDRLKSIRKTLRLTQIEFGKPLNIGQDAISDYENGRNEPNQRTLDAIIKEYSINRIWLFTGVGDMFYTATDHTLKGAEPPEVKNETEPGYVRVDANELAMLYKALASYREKETAELQSENKRLKNLPDVPDKNQL